MATIAVITITVAQTREAIVEEVKENIKAFDKRNAMFVTN
jgi:hypothetical protein